MTDNEVHELRARAECAEARVRELEQERVSLRDALTEVLETEPARRASPSIDCMITQALDEGDE